MDRCQSIYGSGLNWEGSRGRDKKSRDQRIGPGMSWLVARIKLRLSRSFRFLPGFKVQQLGHVPALKPAESLAVRYAVLLGRIVKSRTCVRMLDICIPFSCETNGRISAMN